MSCWCNIEKQEDIDLLMSTYGDFHDACITSLNYQSGVFVDDDMTMHFGGAEEQIVSVIFHRQWNPKAMELQFLGMRQMHLVGRIIICVTFRVHTWLFTIIYCRENLNG